MDGLKIDLTTRMGRDKHNYLGTQKFIYENGIMVFIDAKDINSVDSSVNSKIE